MSMRISSALVALLVLTACDADIANKTALQKAEQSQLAAAEADGRIVCALPGSDDFARRCAIDRTQTQDGLFLTVRHPDGAFHRLLVTKDGRGVIAADGAEQAKVTVLGPDSIEVALAGARYRLPATVAPLKK